MYKLLIVDDEPKIRSGLRLGYPWEELGFTVVGEAVNGLEALDFITVHPVDVILTDILMPVLSGIELAKRLYEQNSIIKVVLLSGYREFEYAQKAIRYGVLDYLVKPTSSNEIMLIFNRLRNALNQQKNNTHEEIDNKQQQYSYHKKIINAIYSYIENNLPVCSLESAARSVNISPYYLSRLFKQQTGLKFSTYFMLKKMELASSLLSDYHYDIGEISRLLGYNSAKNFSKAFKAFHGKSPSAFRNNSSLDEEAN